jgi:hypothetical protein
MSTIDITEAVNENFRPRQETPGERPEIHPVKTIALSWDGDETFLL